MAILQTRILEWVAMPSSVLLVPLPNSQAFVSPSQALSLAPVVPVRSLGSEEGRAPPRGEPPPVTPTPAPPQPLQPDLYLLSLTEPAAVASEVTLFALAPQPASPARSRWKGK